MVIILGVMDGEAENDFRLINLQYLMVSVFRSKKELHSVFYLSTEM